MNRFFLIIFTIVSLPVVSCIRNDIPYPEIDAAITSLDADGAKSVSISTDIHEVVLTLEETVDISKVNIREVSFNDEAVAASDLIVGTKDLSKPLTVTLSAYENERSWAIKAEQPIERYFSLSGQIGGAVIDATNRRVVGTGAIRNRSYRHECVFHKTGARGTDNIFSGNLLVEKL